MDKFYITTAITYTSQKPHIGNTYEIILTDAIARFHRMLGEDVYFLTGTDEHGQKIQQAAEQAGVAPQAYVDSITGQIQEIWKQMNISYDQFIRTTDPQHVKMVQKVFQKFCDQGDIYKGEYEGLYCVPCESFFTASQLVDGKCPDCGREVVPTKEEAYFFKMSKYQDWLLDYIETHPDFIQPASRKREIVNNFLKPGLQDLCVSRTSFRWGIPVPTDENHVIYVWLDALFNYVSALGYDPDQPAEKYQKYWPCNVHVIGKDILRFHTIYWPIFLKALGVPLPEKVFGHPWLLTGGDKMSKSKGNVLYADDLARRFGTDAVRFYVLHEIPYESDGTITYELFIERFNSELANTLGNLINRTVSMVHKYFGGVVPAPGEPTEFDASLFKAAENMRTRTVEKVNGLFIADALDEIFVFARRCNKYIDETTPWVLAKSDEGREKLQTVLCNLIEAIRFIGVLIGPFLPQTGEEILKQAGAPAADFASIATFASTCAGQAVGEAKPLFVRLDEEKVLREIAEEQAAQQVENAPALEPLKPEVTLDDFDVLDLRVARVLECEKVEKADKLLKFKLEDGMGTRVIVSGIAKFYKPEELVGKNVVYIANLKPVKIRGIVSEGMILSAETPDGDLSVVTTLSDVPPGSALH